MSTYAELETRCKRRLGRRGMTITTEFLDEMKAAQEDLENSPGLPNWLISGITAAVAPIPAGTDFFVLHANTPMIRFVDDYAIEYLEEDLVTRSQMKRLDTLQQLKSKEKAGIPAGSIYYYASRLDNAWRIEFRPAQTFDLYLNMRGYEEQAILTGANENGWVENEPNLMLGIAGAAVAVWLRDDRALKYFSELEQRGRRQMNIRIESEDFADTDLVMGDPD